jgi:hypothetical protein
MPGALTIRSLRVVALTPPDHPEPESLRARLEGTVRASLGPALAEVIGDWGGEGILRIHRLEIDLTMGATLPPDHLTERLAEAIADGLLRARADGERILTYAGRSHYLAAFLQELAAGRAWQRWWFRSFDGLKVMPLSAAICTAVLADPGTGLSALLSMPRGALVTVLAKLSGRDVVRVLDSLVSLGTSATSQERVLATLLAARSDSPVAIMLTPTTAALALYLDAVRIDGECGGPRLAELATALVSLDRILADRRSAATIDLARLLDGDAHAGVRAADAALLAQLSSLPADLRQAFIGTAMQRGSAAASDATPRRYTPFGGLFLILPSLDLKSIEEAIKEKVDTETKEDNLSAAGLIGLVTLAACAGRPRAAHVLADPIWRNLFSLPSVADVSTIPAKLASLPEGAWLALEAIGEVIASRADARFLLLARDFAPSRGAARTIACLARATLSRFARRLPGFANSSAPFLWRNLLDVAAAVDSVGAGLSVLLDRCPLDVLLSINGIADADVIGPEGTAIRLRRRPL